MIIFPAKGQTKAAIYVFYRMQIVVIAVNSTVKLMINALGIEVRYLPWPRSEQTMPIMEKSGV